MNIFSAQNEGFKVAKNWFLLGAISLAIAGLYAGLLAGARTPGVHAFMPKDFFNTTLIVHVNLSVFVWLTSFMVCLWSLVRQGSPLFEKLSLWLAIAGAVLMTASPFLGEGHPLLNNYFPVLENVYFLTGLGLYALAVLLKNIGLLTFGLNKTGEVFAFAIYVSGLISICAFAHYFFSYHLMELPEVRELYNSEDFYNRLFWAPGHILQIAYTQLIVIIWLFLSMVLNIVRLERSGFLKAIFALSFVITLPSFIAYSKYSITDFEFMNFFTKHMIHGAGLAAIMAFLLIAAHFIKNTGDSSAFAKPIRNNLVWSIILYMSGGFIGLLITQENTRVPAHYHGSIVGISIAAMGMAFYLMPKFGYKQITGKLANWQGGLYGFGQLLHITGLAVSGGYGALRKTPGAMQSIEGKMAMGLMGLGGLISIIGGLVFVIIIFISIKNSRANA